MKKFIIIPPFLHLVPLHKRAANSTLATASETATILLIRPAPKMTNNAQDSSGLWVVVPVKPFNEGKSRLAGHLSSQRRRALNRELLTRTLAAVNRPRLDAQVLVVSRDSRGLPEESQPCTAPPSCTPNDTESEPQLNAALTQAARHAAAHGATKLLVLPTDMPNLTSEDVRTMAASLGPEPQITIAPSRDGGTNALMLQPAQAIPFAFGRDSFLRHQRPRRRCRHTRPRRPVRLPPLRHRPARRLPARLRLPRLADSGRHLPSPQRSFSPCEVTGFPRTRTLT